MQNPNDKKNQRRRDPITGMTLFTAEELHQSYLRGRTDSGHNSSNSAQYTQHDIVEAHKAGSEIGRKLVASVAEASYEKGYREGFKEGEVAGVNSLEPEKNKSYKEGFLKGRQAGEEEGYQKGIKSSYQSGYDAGREYETQRLIKYGPLFYSRKMTEVKINHLFNRIHNIIPRSLQPVRSTIVSMAVPFGLGLFTRYVKENKQFLSVQQQGYTYASREKLSC